MILKGPAAGEIEYADAASDDEEGSSSFIFVRVWSAPGELGIPIPSPSPPAVTAVSNPVDSTPRCQDQRDYKLAVGTAALVVASLAFWSAAVALYIAKLDRDNKPPVKWNVANCVVVNFQEEGLSGRNDQRCCLLSVIVDQSQVDSFSRSSNEESPPLSVRVCDVTGDKGPALTDGPVEQAFGCDTLSQSSNLQGPYECLVHFNDAVTLDRSVSDVSCFQVGPFLFPNAVPVTELRRDECSDTAVWLSEGLGASSSERALTFVFFALAAIFTCACAFSIAVFIRRELSASHLRKHRCTAVDSSAESSLKAIRKGSTGELGKIWSEVGWRRGQAPQQ